MKTRERGDEVLEAFASGSRGCPLGPVSLWPSIRLQTVRYLLFHDHVPD